jgi:hypothetical protein
MSDDRQHGERIATLEAQAGRVTGDLDRIERDASANLGRVEKAVATLEKRNWVLLAGIAAFLATQFFDIFRGGK